MLATHVTISSHPDDGFATGAAEAKAARSLGRTAAQAAGGASNGVRR